MFCRDGFGAGSAGAGGLRRGLSLLLLISLIFVNFASCVNATKDALAGELGSELAPIVRLQPMHYEECVEDDVGIFELPKSTLECPCTLIMRKNENPEPPNGTVLVVRHSDYKSWKSSGSTLEPYSITKIAMDSDGEWERRTDINHSGEFILLGNVQGESSSKCVELNYIFAKNDETFCPMRLSVPKDAPMVSHNILYGSGDVDPLIQKFMVGVFTPGRGACTGTVVGKNWVLTAAHCAPTVELTKLFIGGASFSAGYEFKVSEVHTHPDFNSGVGPDGQITQAVVNDIALLRTEYEIQAQPIYINMNSRIPYQRDIVRAAGYGLSFKQSERGTLNVVDVSEVPYDECTENYRMVTAGRPFEGMSKRQHICAGPDEFCGGGVCRGDSGGPIMIKLDEAYAQVGITSFGLDCNYKEYAPDVFTRVSHFHRWISDTTNGEVIPVDVAREPVGPNANSTENQEAMRLRENRRRRTIGFSVGGGLLLFVLVLVIGLWYFCMKHRNRTGAAGR